jgi:hypothetical protein
MRVIHPIIKNKKIKPLKKKNNIGTVISINGNNSVNSTINSNAKVTTAKPTSKFFTNSTFPPYNTFIFNRLQLLSFIV